MIPLVIGLLALTLAFAGWRWGLGNRNWLEGGLVAAVAGGLVGTVAHFAVRAVATATSQP